jgi:hypothetical protein
MDGPTDGKKYDSPKGMKVTAGISTSSGMLAIVEMPATTETPTKARMLTTAGTPEMVEAGDS